MAKKRLPSPAGAFIEILLVDVGLQRRAGLAGDDEQGARQIDFGLDRPNLRGIGGVEHVQARKSGNVAERERQHLRAQTGAAHAEQDRVGKTFAFDLLREGMIALELIGADAVEPAEPAILVGAGPQRFVAPPEPADIIRAAPRPARTIFFD